MYYGERGIALDPVQGSRASSRVDLGYTEQFHILCDISVILDLGGYSWGLSGIPCSKSRLLKCFIGKTDLLCMQCKGIGPGLWPSGKSHVFSRVAVGTWGIFSIYPGDGHSKLMFVQ